MCSHGRLFPAVFWIAIAALILLVAAPAASYAGDSKQSLTFSRASAPQAFLHRGPGYELSFAPSEVVLASGGEAVRVQFAPAPVTDIRGLQSRGPDAYGEVRYYGVYPGIEVGFSGYQRQLTFEFLVPAGVDPGSIMLRVQGARRATVDREGSLLLDTAAGALVLHAPRAEQGAGALRRAIPGSFRGSGAQFGLTMTAYDTSLPLVIRALLDYSAAVPAAMGAATRDAAYSMLAAAPRAAVTAGAVRSAAGFNTNTLSANDDGSTGLVNIGFTINFFGRTYNQLYVNNNGNVTFDRPLGTYTPFNLYTTRTPIIAAFFADVDTRGAGSGLVKYGNETIDGRPAFGVNYLNVGYYGSHTDKLNSFQLLLIDRSDVGAGDFDIEFNYDRVRWETGDASSGSGGLGGHSARAGYSNGTETAGTSFEITGSAVNGAFLDSNLTTGLIHNAMGSPVSGRFRFPVRNGAVGTSACATGTSAAVGSVCTSRTDGSLFTPGGGTVYFTFNIRRLSGTITVLGSTTTPGLFVLQMCTTTRGRILVLRRGFGLTTGSVTCP